jgi:hypothetical protein
MRRSFPPSGIAGTPLSIDLIVQLFWDVLKNNLFFSWRSMNKSDPDRARCSAPEEEYEATHTPESAADARTRKHLRVWVRRLQTNEGFEARQPTLTRGKKRAVASSSKDPYEWVRCCNPSCGKWRAVLRIMDAKSNVIDRTLDGEWYCRCVCLCV